MGLPPAWLREEGTWAIVLGERGIERKKDRGQRYGRGKRERKKDRGTSFFHRMNFYPVTMPQINLEWVSMSVRSEVNQM
jgi:hypothetical protein